ncbi:MAG: S41 family peptidase, partial [Lysobacterales bacterium]
MIRTSRQLILTLILLPALITANETEAVGSRAQLSLDDLRTFTDVFNQVRKNFVEELDDHELMNAAIRGMLSELDPHSSYMEADEYRQLDDDARGRYSGIGVEIGIQNKQARVVYVMDGGAADKAGVVAGDIITSIDQEDLRGQNLHSAVDRLRRAVGSKVEITVKHQNGEVSMLELERGFVEVSSVFSRPVDDDYGYFQVTHFTRKSADELLEQIQYMQDNREGPLKGIVLDLRRNSGGVLNAAVTMADGFLDDGLIVSTRGRAENQLEYTAKPGQWLEGV